MEGSNHHVTVLIVGDDLLALQMYRDQITKLLPGCTIHTASNHNDALYIFTLYKHNIIVIDVANNMSDNGNSVACRICKVKSNAYILFVTSDPNPFFCNTSKTRCMKEILKKPIDIKDITDRILERIQEVHKHRVG